MSVRRSSRRARREPLRLTYADSKASNDEDVSSVSSTAESPRGAKKLNRKRKFLKGKSQGGAKRASPKDAAEMENAFASATMVDEDDHLLFLFDEIRSEDASLEDSVQSFLNRCKRAFANEKSGVRERTPPLMEILAVILLSSHGIFEGDEEKNNISLRKVVGMIRDNVKNNEGTLDVETLVDDFCDNVTVPKRYPIVGPGNTFRKSFCEFFKRLVARGEHSMIYREEFLEDAISWIVCCSSGSLRSLRHTASLAAFTIASQMLRVIADLNEKLEIAERRLKTEQKKGSASKKKSKRVADGEKVVEKMETRIASLQQAVMNIFHGVFVHRSDDIAAPIRADAVVAFGTWALLDPEFILSRHVSRLSKQITDFSAIVRLRAVESLTTLCVKLPEESLQSLRTFVGRTRKTLMNIARDIDDRVMAAGIALFTEMRKRKNLLVSNKKLDRVERETFESILFESNAVVQRRAAKYLRANVKGLGSTKVPQRQLVSLIEMAERHGDVNYGVKHVDSIVCAFENELEALKDCDAMARLLLKDGGGALSTDLSVAILARVMTVSFAQLKRRCDPNVSHLRKRKLEEAKKVAETFGRTLVRELPSMLDRYLADVNIFRELVKLPALIDVEHVESTSGHAKKFASIMSLLQRAFMSNADEQIFVSVAEALQRFTEASHPQHAVASKQVSVMVTSLASEIATLVAEESSDEGDSSSDVESTKKKSKRRGRVGSEIEDDEDTRRKSILCVRRLAHLMRWMDVRRWIPDGSSVLERCMAVLETSVTRLDTHAGAADIVREVPNFVVTWLLWQSNSVFSKMFAFQGSEKATKENAGVDASSALPGTLCADVDMIRKHVRRLADIFIVALKKLTSSGDAKDAVAGKVMRRSAATNIFLALADLRVIFSRSQITRKFVGLAQACDVALNMSDEDIVVMAKASKFLFDEIGDAIADIDEDSDEEDEEDAEAVVRSRHSVEREEIAILRAMSRLSGPGLRIVANVEGAYLLSLRDRCHSSAGNNIVDAWCRTMGKQDPSRYLDFQLATLKRNFCDRQNDRSDETLTQEQCVENYVALLDSAKKLSRFFGVGHVPKKLVRSYLKLVENGIRFALRNLPERLGFLDVLDYYVRVLSISDTARARRIFDAAVAERGVREFREQDPDSSSRNEGAWEAFDSFDATVRRSRKQKKTNENEPPATGRGGVKRRGPSSPSRNSPGSPTLHLSDEDERGSPKRMRSSGSRQQRGSSLRLQDLSDEE
eukprot:g1316.t1